MNNVVFISEMRNPKTDASSTQIMVRNILLGMKKNVSKLTFIAIVTKDCNRRDVQLYYQDIVDEIIFADTLSGKKRGRYGTMFSIFFASFRRPVLREKILIDDKTTIVTHSPTIDSVLYARMLKKRKNNVRIVQYWSDPITCALVTVEEYRFKRVLFKYIENKILGYADSIVYGTKTLYDNQRRMFPKYDKKMGYCDVCYNPLNKDLTQGNETIKFGYFGNYYTNIRDIRPFYNAFEKIQNANLVICGYGDAVLKPKKNIQILPRVSQQDVVSFESGIDVEVCLLNKVGFQIPGKIFYATNTNKKILVILDGPVSKDIYEYLKTFNRFIFCQNKSELIYDAICEIICGKYENIDLSEMYRLSPEYVALSILNGGV